MADTPELLPCPFCGDQAEIAQFGTRKQSCIVECTNCGARHSSSDTGNRNGESWNARAAPPKLDAPKHCEWQFSDDDDCIWHTDCGDAHIFMNGGPKENYQEYCGYCGGKLIIGPPQGPQGE